MIRTSVKTKGGNRLKASLLKGKRAAKTGLKSVEVGFFSTAKYQDGTPVTNVAAWNEFGTQVRGSQFIPPRPFFRNANITVRGELKVFLTNNLDTKTGVLTPQQGSQMGLILQGNLQESITKLKAPPNAPRTIEIKRKKGKGGEVNPLIDTGKMRTSVTHKVNR